MKKALVFFILIFSAGMVFSQSYNPNVLINSFGYVSFEPLQMVIPTDGSTKFYTGSGVPWGDHSKIDLYFTMTDPQYRFGAEINLEKEYDQNALRHILDSATVWIRPFSWLRLDVGSFQVGTYQGSYGASDFIQYIGPTEEDQYTIFQYFRGVGGTGVLLSFTPMENLFIGTMINPTIGARYDNYREQDFDAADIYKNGQYAVAYTFPELGTARLQYIGGFRNQMYVFNDPDSPFFDPEQDDYFVPSPIPLPLVAANIAYAGNPLSFQAAFAYNRIENLTIDAGFTYPLRLSDDFVTTRRPVKISAAAIYRDSRWSIAGRMDFGFPGWTQVVQSEYIQYVIDNGFTLNFNFTAGYNLGFATVGTEFAMKYGAPNKGIRRYPNLILNPDPDPDSESDAIYIYDVIEVPESDTSRLVLGAGAWIMKQIGNASIKIGLAVSFPTRNYNEKAYDLTKLETYDIDRYAKGPWVFTIPIVFGYWL